MGKIKHVATRLGLGIGAVYAFFLIPSIEQLFIPTFLILLRQILALGFAACLLINPESLIETGERFGPKLLSILNLMFTNKKKDKENGAGK